MTKPTKPQKTEARILSSRLRGMVQLQHFEAEDRFIVMITIAGKTKFWIEWGKFVEIFDAFDAIVKAKMIRK